MEAAVLNPQIMSADVKCGGGGGGAINAELEVKKLQELVRKLEMQNEQLRTRATAHLFSASPLCGTGGRCLPSPPPTVSCPPSSGHHGAPDEPFQYFQPNHPDDGACTDPTVLDEVELLDLDSVFPGAGGSDETWLYISQKALLWREGGLTPTQWCRQVLDSPHPDVEVARRSFCQRLDTAHRWRGVFPTPTSSAFPHCRIAGVSPLCSSPPSSRSCSALTPPSVHASERPASSVSPSHPLHPLALTPPGKDCSPLAERTPTFLYHQGNRSCSLRRSPFSPQSSLDSELSASELEDNSISMGYKLQDLTDVQVMARLQEESLRQEFATTSASVNRRSASFSFQFGQQGDSHLEEEEDEDDEEDYGQLPPPQPRLTRTGPFQRGLSHSHTFTSIRDWRKSTSNLSTPSVPQFSSAFHFQSHSTLTTPNITTFDQQGPKTDQGPRPSSVEFENKLRRSMPNLVRAPSMPSVPSPVGHVGSTASIRNSQSFDSSSGLSRLQSAIPSPGQLQNRVQSVGNFLVSSRPTLKATAYVSPTVKGSATIVTSTSLQSLTSSGIPLPSKPSGIQAAGRSGLPRPASFLGTSSTLRSKIAQPVRSLLTPPKNLTTLSALRDGAWKDGCY